MAIISIKWQNYYRSNSCSWNCNWNLECNRFELDFIFNFQLFINSMIFWLVSIEFTRMIPLKYQLLTLIQIRNLHWIENCERIKYAQTKYWISSRTCTVYGVQRAYSEVRFFLSIPNTFPYLRTIENSSITKTENRTKNVDFMVWHNNFENAEMHSGYHWKSFTIYTVLTESYFRLMIDAFVPSNND